MPTAQASATILNKE